MTWNRAFTRPLMSRCAGHSAALAALDDVQRACHLDATGTPEPAIITK